MIRPAAWLNLTHAYYDAHHNLRCADKAAGRAWTTALAISIEMQAHRALCDELRWLAACIVSEPHEARS